MAETPQNTPEVKQDAPKNTFDVTATPDAQVWLDSNKLGFEQDLLTQNGVPMKLEYGPGPSPCAFTGAKSVDFQLDGSSLVMTETAKDGKQITYKASDVKGLTDQIVYEGLKLMLAHPSDFDISDTDVGSFTGRFNQLQAQFRADANQRMENLFSQSEWQGVEREYQALIKLVPEQSLTLQEYGFGVQAARGTNNLVELKRRAELGFSVTKDNQFQVFLYDLAHGVYNPRP